MNTILNLPFFILIILTFISYIIGSFSMSHIISKKKGIDFKKSGAKNLGTSNTVLLVGVKAGIIVLLSDILKVMISMVGLSFLCNMIDKMNLSNMSTVSCNMLDILSLFAAAGILGHIFPVYLNFDGGKGFATYIGSILTLSFTCPSIFFILVIAILFALISVYIVMATFTVISLTPLYFLFIGEYVSMSCFLIVSIIIFIKHIENIKRIINKKEPKIKKSLKKEYEDEIEKIK